MTSQVILSLGNSDADSSEFTIRRGEHKNLYMFSDTNIKDDVVLHILRKNILGYFDKFSILHIDNLFLTDSSKLITLDIPGNYKIHRNDISDYGVSVGVEITD